jgi:hypothetical protein
VPNGYHTKDWEHIVQLLHLSYEVRPGRILVMRVELIGWGVLVTMGWSATIPTYYYNFWGVLSHNRGKGAQEAIGNRHIQPPE